MNKKLLIGLGLALAATASTNAFADSCDNLASNATWTSNFSKLETAVEKGQYDDAVEYAKPLFGICQKSPALLYYTGLAMKGKGDADRATQYFIKAAEMTSDVAVDPGMSRRIWYARYEAEHPEATPEALKAKADELAAEQAKYNELKSEWDAKNVEEREEQARMEVAGAYLIEESKRNWGGAMWAGVGITAGGLILAITGGVLSMKVDKIEKSGETNADKSGFAVTKTYVASWAMLGAGIAMTVGGAVLTGIAGYHYAKIDLDNDGSADESVSFNVLPGSVSFGMTF